MAPKGRGKGKPLFFHPPLLPLPSLKKPIMQPVQMALPQDLAGQLSQGSYMGPRPLGTVLSLGFTGSKLGWMSFKECAGSPCAFLILIMLDVTVCLEMDRDEGREVMTRGGLTLT